MSKTVHACLSDIEDTLFASPSYRSIISEIANILIQVEAIGSVAVCRYDQGKCQLLAATGILSNQLPDSFHVDNNMLDAFNEQLSVHRVVGLRPPIDLDLPGEYYDLIALRATPVGTFILLHYEQEALHVDDWATLIQAFTRWNRVLHQLNALDELHASFYDEEQHNVLAAKSSEHLARISHELRTPMSSVIAIPDMLESTGLSPEQKKLVSYLKSAGNMLVHIVNQVLSFSSLNMADSKSLEIKDFDLVLLLYDVFNALYPQAEEKRIYMKTVLMWPLPRRIKSCRTAFQHILMNIMGNCIKYTSDGGVTVSMRWNGRSICLDVKDTGSGMNSAFIRNIFEPFHQEQKGADTNNRGIGLGMTITRKYIDLLGGNIKIQSRLGLGTVFHVEIPIEQAEDNRVASSGRIITIGNYTTHMLISDMFTHQQGVIVSKGDRAAVECADASSLFVIEYEQFVNNDSDVYSLLSTNSLDDHSVVILTNSLGEDRVLDAVISSSAFKHVYIVDRNDTNALFACLSSHFSADRNAIGKDISRAHMEDISVLVVEDHELNRHIVQSYLKDIGIYSDSAADGVRAISMLNERHYDLAIVDLSMPDVSGFDVIRAYKDRGLYQDTRFIVLTADVRYETEEKCRQLGVDDFLTKPIEKDIFLHAVLNLLHVSDPDGSHSHAVVSRSSEEGATHAFSSAIFDMERVMSLMSDAGLFKELLTMWYENAPSDLAMLRDACDNADVRLCRQLVHRIRSSAGNVCIHSFGKMTEDIEFNQSEHSALNRSINFCNHMQSVLDKVRLMMLEAGWLDEEKEAANRR